MSSAQATTWSFAHSAAVSASANFCPDCKSILDLPDADLILRCPTCKYQMRFGANSSDYEKLSVSTKYSKSGAGPLAASSSSASSTPSFTRAKVKERCPSCNHPEMSFYTMQMRSVDEGQTVFFECNKCGYRYSTNT